MLRLLPAAALVALIASPALAQKPDRAQVDAAWNALSAQIIKDGGEFKRQCDETVCIAVLVSPEKEGKRVIMMRVRENEHGGEVRAICIEPKPDADTVPCVLPYDGIKVTLIRKGDDWEIVEEGKSI